MLKRILLFGLLASLTTCQPRVTLPSFDAVQYVDPQLGSVHGRWFFYTPAALPFGMAKLAPHTNAYMSIGSWLPHGYDDRHTSIEGFGHFHEFQIGGVVVMPTVGTIQTMPGTLEDPDGGYRSRFDKADEHAEPGYYTVLLKDYGVKAELTATQRVGFHRYTFPASDAAQLVFDVGHKQGESSDVTEAYIKLSGEKAVEGYVITYPEYAKFCDPGKRVKMFFYAQLSKAPQATGTFVDSLFQPGPAESKGVGNGLVLTFKTAADEVIEMQVGLSYTSIANARNNLEAEARAIAFDEVRANARLEWNQMLGRIRAEGGRSEDLTKFYTGLYHALLGRGLASDGNGQYPRNDGGIGQIPLDKKGKPRYRHFNTDGIWGGFWNLTQLWALVYPDFLREYLQSNLDFYAETGWLHDGLAAGVHTNGVQTNFFGLVLASAYHCGIELFDVELAYEAALKNELGWAGRPFGSGKYDLHYLVEYGYIPSKDTTISNGWVFNFGASHTLEYAFSSYAVAQFAKKMGREEDYQRLMAQAGAWKNLFDEETKFIRPKYEDGTFIENFNPLEAWRGFQEGNAYQYTWYVPHDQAGLMEKMGADLYRERLRQTFEESRKSRFGGGEEIHSFSGIETLYNHGNQPSLFHSWLFNYAGQPWLTQKWTRLIRDEFYGTEPLHGYGFGQDEDQGQLGAWYVMAALGLFDVQGHAAANPTFQFGSPQFDKVTLLLANDPAKLLVIETLGNGPASYFVQALSFNGQPIEDCWIEREKLLDGGTLTFVLDSIPNQNWGIRTPPPSQSTAGR
jgi:predicted alpha-1,2-mannosidase